MAAFASYSLELGCVRFVSETRPVAGTRNRIHSGHMALDAFPIVLTQRGTLGFLLQSFVGMRVGMLKPDLVSLFMAALALLRPHVLCLGQGHLDQVTCIVRILFEVLPVTNFLGVPLHQGMNGIIFVVSIGSLKVGCQL